MIVSVCCNVITPFFFLGIGRGCRGCLRSALGVIHFWGMGRCNDALRVFIREHWGKMTDGAMASANDCERVKVRNLRVSLGLRRDRAHLRRMYDSHLAGKVYVGRGPDFRARQLSAMQIANRKAKGLL